MTGNASAERRIRDSKTSNSNWFAAALRLMAIPL